MIPNDSLSYLTFLFNDEGKPVVSRTTFELYNHTSPNLSYRHTSDRNISNNNASPKKYVLTSNGLCQITRL